MWSGTVVNAPHSGIFCGLIMQIKPTSFFETPNLAPQNLRNQVVSAVGQLVKGPWCSLSGGRTNRLWRVGNVVVKQFDIQVQSLLFPNDPIAETRALLHLAQHNLAPTLYAAGPNWLAYHFVEGQSWSQNSELVAQHLGRLHKISAPETMFRAAPSGSAAVFEMAQRLFALCSGPILPPPKFTRVLGLKTPNLIHADVVAGNIIVGPEGLRFIDWQCPALGDPAEDLAMFLSPAMQMLYRGQTLSAEDCSQFLAAYPDQLVVARLQDLKLLFHYRMAAYCLWRAQNGLKDYQKGYELEKEALERPFY